MSRVFFDTMLFIYAVEEHAEFGPRVFEIQRGMARRGDQPITSPLTFGEALTIPYRFDDLALAAKYREIFRTPGIEIVPFNEGAAERFARIRGTLALSPADSMQLACAAEAGANLFLTNDRRLVGKRVDGIDFIADLTFSYW